MPSKKGYGKKRKVRYQIDYKENGYNRRSFAFTKKTAREKARMFNGKIKVVNKVF